MIEVQVRCDDGIDGLRFDINFSKRIHHRPSLQLVDAAFLLRPLVAAPGFHQNTATRSLEKQAVRIESDAVHLVGARPFRPDRFRDDSEHPAAVEAKSSRL